MNVYVKRGAYEGSVTSQFSPLEIDRRRCRMILFAGDQDVAVSLSMTLWGVDR